MDIKQETGNGSIGSIRSIGSIGADLFTNILIGAGDGIIVPLALYAGMTSAGFGSQAIIPTGILVTATTALLFGVGGWLTRKNAELQPKNFLRDEMDENRKDKKLFLANLGLDDEMQQQAINEMAKDDAEWDQFRDKYAGSDTQSATVSSAIAGILIATSFAIAGLLTLLPFFFDASPLQALALSAGCMLPALFLLGYLKGRVTGQQGASTGGLMLLMGCLASGAAFAVARLFH